MLNLILIFLKCIILAAGAVLGLILCVLLLGLIVVFAPVLLVGAAIIGLIIMLSGGTEKFLSYDVPQENIAIICDIRDEI